jgi:succinate dehydrogenase/fumarate reductase flavoprotein subunit
LPELMIAGMMVTRPEVATLLTMPSPRAVRLATRLFARYAIDRIRHSRGTRLVLGNALVAQLFHAVREARVPIRFGCVPSELLVDARRISGVRIRDGVGETTVHARQGVVLAGGGFPGNDEMRARLLPAPPPKFTAAWEAASGDTLALGESAGAAFQSGGDNALWFPSSVMTRHDGSTAVYPHIVLDRAKPGLIAVGADGRRFVDEAVSYHEFVRAMYRAHERGATTVPAYLICDRTFLWTYGLGMIRPHTRRLGRYLRHGYLKDASSIEELAARTRIDRAGLVDTVARHNAFARAGTDNDFGKGSRAYDRSNGDPSHLPNPCLGTVASPPYYSVVVWPTPLATSWGIRINEWSQALDHDGAVIEGLYACGNDMQSITGGEYPGPGGQIGPGMTFGYLAARHAANSRSTMITGTRHD